MERKQIMSTAFLDLSAAFDTVDHDLLLEILEKQFGIHQRALHWYDSYLRPRSFRVCVGESYSDQKKLTFSVPQGSASSANLFTAYSSSYSKIIEHTLSLQGFADGHFIKLVFEPSQENAENDAIRELEKAMLLTKSWMDCMRLKMNPDKTEFILFGTPQELKKCSSQYLNVNGQLINRSQTVKCLGAWLDSNLNFKYHVNKKCQTAMFNFRRIRSVRKYLNADSCETLVLSLVISHLDYCNGILLGLPLNLLKRYQIIQNMCARLVLNRDRHSSATQSLHDLNWLPINARIEFKALTIIHKCLFGNGPEYLRNLFVWLPTPVQTLRSSSDITNKLVIPKVARKTLAARAISVKGPELWNNLPRNIRSCTDLKKFKDLLQSHLISKTLY